MPYPSPLDLESLRARFLGRDPEGALAGEARGYGFFEAALGSLPMPAAILRQGEHVWANPAYARLLGKDGPSAVIGRSMEAFLEPGSWRDWQGHTHGGGAHRAHHLVARMPEGSEPARELDFSLQPFHQGATDYHLVTAQDLQVLRQAEEAFRRNEHWWRHFFEASIVGVAVLTPERKILDANQALLDLAGFTLEEVVGRDWADWLDTAEAEGPGLKGGQGPAPLRAELTILRKDGLAVPIRVGSHPIYTPGGAVQCYLALVQDLTELHAHQAREALLLQAIEQSPATIVITDATGDMQYVNEAFTRTTGYRREEAIGRNPRVLKSGVQTQAFYREMWETISRGEAWTGRLCNRRKDGSTYWEQATLSPVFEGKRLSHFLAVKEDISDRLSLEASHERLASAISQAREGIFLATPGGRLLYANEALQALLPPGQPHPLPGSPLHRHLPERHRVETFRAMRKALRAGGVWEGRLRYPEESTRARARVLGGTLSLVHDTDGRGSCVVGVFQDLTRELEEERNALQVEKMNTLGALAGGVVHDLNNVLSAILTASELLEWDLAEDKSSHAKLQVIRQAVLRAREINRRIQAFSRQEHERLIPFDLSALVKEVAALLKATLPSNIHFATSVEGTLWTTGNPAQLHQVLMNLAVNSYQALEGGEGELEILLQEEEPLPEPGEAGSGAPTQLRLVVSDNGPGIPGEILEHIFEPYFTTKGGSGGTGLGLPVVQKIITAHGGTIQVESAPGHGTTTTILLPRAPRPNLAEPPVPSDHDLVGIESVLLVGEDEVQVALMKQGMNRLGYQVTALVDGMQALEAVRRNPRGFDVVVTEPHPRGLAGTDLLTRLRQFRQDLALIRITELGMSPEDALDPGLADAFLARPVGLQDLARSIREVAPRTRPQEPASEATGHSRNLCVLLAEDSSSTRALVRNWLRKLGCEVLEARDGELAWELFVQHQERLDFVFTDIVMPRMDGLRLTERIRTASPRMPVVVLTSLEDHDASKSALNLGVEELLNKPFSQQQLVACVDRLVGKLQDRRRTKESHVTAHEVRQAQLALVATPEPDAPFCTVHHSLTDAGGDLFRWFRRPDGSLWFVLGDVVGHSVRSSYAVAAFLGMLASLAPKASDLRDLADRLNQSVLEGPFPDVPICALLGQWDMKRGRVHLVNAGIPHGCLSDNEGGRNLSIAINGTPLGFFGKPSVEEKVLWLREGDRLLFSTDGVMECSGADGTPFEEKALHVWSTLGGTPVPEALGIFCAAAQVHGTRGIQDDVLVVAFEQGPTAPEGASFWIPSELAAVDGLIDALGDVVDHHRRDLPITRSERFTILTAVREALINAISHGNRDRPELQVFVQALWLDGPPRLQVVVSDDGLGFEEPEDKGIPDPGSTRGRGLPFIYTYAATTSMVGGELTLTFAWEP